MGRRGTTLVELVVSLALFGLVAALILAALVNHQRAARSARASATEEAAVREAVAVASRALRGAAAQDVLASVSGDSALEFMAPVGAGQGCANGNRLVAAAPSPVHTASLASYQAAPREGDRVLVLDGRAHGWAALETRIVRIEDGGPPCAVAGVAPVRQVTLVVDSVLPAGLAVFTLSRRTRFTLYRGGDGDWQLGMREWNPRLNRLDAVQPVAGPLARRHPDRVRSGLVFVFRDSVGRLLALPLDSGAVASVEIVARSASRLRSGSRVVALRRDR